MCSRCIADDDAAVGPDEVEEGGRTFVVADAMHCNRWQRVSLTGYRTTCRECPHLPGLLTSDIKARPRRLVKSNDVAF
jgi:hypothetical protein